MFLSFQVPHEYAKSPDQYYMKSRIFGNTSSSSVATFALHEVAEENLFSQPGSYRGTRAEDYMWDDPIIGLHRDPWENGSTSFLPLMV